MPNSNLLFVESRIKSCLDFDINFCYRGCNIYRLVIGKFFAAATLGFYTQAQNVRKLASQNLISVIQKVTYPLLSKTADDPKRMKRGYRQVIQTSTFIIFPGMVLLFIFAEPLIDRKSTRLNSSHV